MKAKRFVVAIAKPYSEDEKARYNQYINARKQKRVRLPAVEEFAKVEGARLTKKGLVIDWESERSNVILGQLKEFSIFCFHPRSIVQVNAERIAIIKQLSALGYKIAVPKYSDFKDTQDYEKHLGKIKGFARTFEATPKVISKITQKGRTIKTIDSSAVWARDLWQKAGGKRITRFSKSPENIFGEGGKTVFLPNKVVLANNTLKENASAKELQAIGYRFFFLESGEMFNADISSILKKNVFERFSHIDIFAGTAGKILLVDREYYWQNKPAIEEAAKAAGLKILFVPETEKRLYPANFLPLEENKILMDRDAKQTIALLEKNGLKVIPTAVSLKANRRFGGGIRCIVNEL